MARKPIKIEESREFTVEDQTFNDKGKAVKYAAERALKGLIWEENGPEDMTTEEVFSFLIDNAVELRKLLGEYIMPGPAITEL